MEIIKNKKQLIGTELFERDCSEIKENLPVILELIEGSHLLSEGEELFVAQQILTPAGEWGEEIEESIAKYRLVDWYLACDTDSADMTDEEIEEFLSLGGIIRS